MYILLRKHKTKDWEKVEEEKDENDILLLKEEYENNHDHSFMFKVEKI